MITIAQSVEDIVASTPFVEEALGRHLLNLSAYARAIRPQIQEKHLKTVTIASLVMALKRLQPRCKGRRVALYDLVKLRDITVESSFVEYTFRNTPTLNKLQRALIDLTEEKDLCMNFAQGIHESTLVVHHALEKDVDHLAKKEHVLSKISGLSLITIRLPVDTVETPGVYYPILKALAWAGINFIEIISVSSELTIIFRDKDVDRAFSVIKGLIGNSTGNA